MKNHTSLSLEQIVKIIYLHKKGVKSIDILRKMDLESNGTIIYYLIPTIEKIYWGKKKEELTPKQGMSKYFKGMQIAQEFLIKDIDPFTISFPQAEQAIVEESTEEKIVLQKEPLIDPNAIKEESKEVTVTIETLGNKELPLVKPEKHKETREEMLIRLEKTRSKAKEKRDAKKLEEARETVKQLKEEVAKEEPIKTSDAFDNFQKELGTSLAMLISSLLNKERESFKKALDEKDHAIEITEAKIIKTEEVIKSLGERIANLTKENLDLNTTNKSDLASVLREKIK